MLALAAILHNVWTQTNMNVLGMTELTISTEWVQISVAAILAKMEEIASINSIATSVAVFQDILEYTAKR